MSSLRYAKKRRKELNYTPLKAVEVLYFNMASSYKIEKETLKLMEKKLEMGHAKTSLAELKDIYQKYKKAQELAIDCAYKLAPYQAPKLESIEVKSQVEHKFVMRSPKRVQSVDEWAKLTGADKLQYKNNEQRTKEFTPPAPSIHDFDTPEMIKPKLKIETPRGDPEDDEINTHKGLLN